MAVRRVTVLGAGRWGTALAMQLARNGLQVTLADPRPGVEPKSHFTQFPSTLSHSTDVPADLSVADMCVVACPSPHLRATSRLLLAPFLRPAALVVVASKGLDEATLQTPHELLSSALAANPIVGLGGPSFAAEVALGLPTCVVLASTSPGAAATAARAFHGDRFRCFTSVDVLGVELGAALKNVYAIAVGVSDGVGMGANARAALISRGLNEMTRIAVAKGGSPLTMLGLGGLGDLVLTCTGDLSRNRRVGLALGRGVSCDEALAALGGQVAEGVGTARTGWALARSLGVAAPILENVHALLYEGKPVKSAVQDLMSLELRGEWE